MKTNDNRKSIKTLYEKIEKKNMKIKKKLWKYLFHLLEVFIFK